MASEPRFPINQTPDAGGDPVANLYDDGYLRVEYDNYYVSCEEDEYRFCLKSS